MSSSKPNGTIMAGVRLMIMLASGCEGERDAAALVWDRGLERRRLHAGHEDRVHEEVAVEVVGAPSRHDPGGAQLYAELLGDGACDLDLEAGRVAFLAGEGQGVGVGAKGDFAGGLDVGQRLCFGDRCESEEGKSCEKPHFGSGLSARMYATIAVICSGVNAEPKA